jgi:hypothetical protein
MAQRAALTVAADLPVYFAHAHSPGRARDQREH